MSYTITMSSKKSTLRIQDIPNNDRPRERLLKLGAENLADEELLAILIGSGTKDVGVVELSKKIVKQTPLAKLQTLSHTDLRSIKGMGNATAMRIMVAVELGRRIWEETPKPKILHPDDVMSAVHHIRDMSREYMVALYLNARHELLDMQTVAIGKLNLLIVEPRDILMKACELPCGYIVLTHNHPSGDPTPSSEDIEWTKKMTTAATLLGISLLDHVIVTKHTYVSLKEEGIINN